MSQGPTHTLPSGFPPVIVDLGKQKRKAVKKLMRSGDGRLAEQVEQVIADVRSELGPDAATVELVPVVVVYRRKARRASDLAALLGGAR